MVSSTLSVAETVISFLHKYSQAHNFPARLHFPASLAAGYGHATKFSWTECEKNSVGWHLRSFKTRSEHFSVSSPACELGQGQHRWGPSPRVLWTIKVEETCLWMTHWGSTPSNLAIHLLEMILCSQSHQSAGSHLQQLNRGPYHTTVYVTTRTNPL